MKNKLLVCSIVFTLGALNARQLSAQCNAGFTFTYGTGGTVNFTSTSSGATSPSYFWYYGNFSVFSNQANPSHTFTPGIHYVCLSYQDLQDSSCNDLICDTVMISSGTGVADLNNNYDKIHNFPNPFTTQTTFTLSKEVKNASLLIHDLFGKEAQNINFSGQQVIVKREDLSNGTYFYQIISEEKNVATGKLIIQPVE